jgi:CheY-like chemotaxis protein
MAQLKIHVVEDNPVIAGMIRRFLTKSGYGITGIVTTGEEAVELAGKSMPDLKLMDVQLGVPNLQRGEKAQTAGGTYPRASPDASRGEYAHR